MKRMLEQLLGAVLSGAGATLILASHGANAAAPGNRAGAAGELRQAQAGFFDPESVQTLRLELSTESLQALARALPERIFVRGSFHWNEQRLENVGIRYKGNSSSHPASPHKRGFLIKFSEFEPGQEFLGLRRVALDNAIQFGSLFSERLITDILRDLGVKAPRCNYARLYLNGEYLGVYVNVERIDETFLERQFGDASGPLFKVHEGGPGADLRFLGADPRLYQQTFDLETKGSPRAYQQLAEFIEAVNNPDSGAGADLASILDLDSFLKTTAVMLLAGAFDQYTGWGPHNYYLYRNPADQRWSYLTWDLDVGFADRAFGRVPVLEGWHAGWPAPLPGRPLLERIVNSPEWLARYRRTADGILEKHFRPEILVAKLRALHAQIREDLERDPYPKRRVTNPADSSYADIVLSMEDFMRKRYALARSQLDTPGPRPAPMQQLANAPTGQPAPGPDSADAPSGLRAIHVEAGRVELEWTDNAQGERAFIIQRSPSTPEARFENAVGLPGENLTSGVDPHARPGETYRYRVYAVKPTPAGPQGTGVSNTLTVTVPAR